MFNLDWILTIARKYYYEIMQFLSQRYCDYSRDVRGAQNKRVNNNKKKIGKHCEISVDAPMENYISNRIA